MTSFHLKPKRPSAKKPLITIAGVMGKQGRSAARTLIESGRFRVRGITSRAHLPEAQQMAAAGIELISLPLRPGFQRAYTEAFMGSDGVFFMTPNIVPPATHEFDLGRQLADAAVAAGVEHIIFSSLENVDAISDGALYAPHFTDKAKIEQYIRSLPIHSSFIMLAFFYTNFMEFYVPSSQNGKLVFPVYLPKDFPAPFVDPLTATGPAVAEIFSHPEKYSGKSLPVIGDILSPQQMVDTFTEVTAKKAVYAAAYTKQDLLHYFPALGTNEDLVREILGMAHYAAEHGYFAGHRDLSWSRSVLPNTVTWKTFLQKTNWQGQSILF